MTRRESGVRQIALPLGWEAEAAREIIVTPPMEEALGPLLFGDNWAQTGAILTGPPRSGKTLLGQWLAKQSGAILIDDAEDADDEALFHAWNRAREAGRPCLLTAADGPGQWGIGLADLKSRIASALLVRIPPPDDALMRELLTRHLARFGTSIRPDALDYAVRRIERSHAAAESFAAAANMHSLAAKKPITLPLVRGLLGELSAGG